MSKKVFIDGRSGTTGLRIEERLKQRTDITLLTLPEEQRRDENARHEALNTCDIAFLCLPDDAAIRAVQLVENPDTVILDTSTAHRTDPGFVYGFPELDGQRREQIRHARRIAVPGCHASGFIALTAPLVKAGILKPDARLSCFSLTGYSGGGKAMIADYRSPDRSPLLGAPRQYALTQNHKHLREMQAFTGLTFAPAFCPVVADFYSGMEVTVPLFVSELNGDAGDVRRVLAEAYRGCEPIVTVAPDTSENGFLSAAAFSGKDTMQLTVTGNDERLLLVARYDNLGKGASGAAVECLNLILGVSPTAGLSI